VDDAVPTAKKGAQEHAPAGVPAVDMAWLALDAARAAVLSTLQAAHEAQKDDAAPGVVGTQEATSVIVVAAPEEHVWEASSCTMSGSYCVCAACDKCSATSLDAVQVITTHAVDSLCGYHEAVAADATRFKRCVVQVPISSSCALAQSLLQLTGLQQTNAGWQIMAVARVQPHSTSDMLMMARCLQRAVAAEKASLAVAGGGHCRLDQAHSTHPGGGDPSPLPGDFDQLQLEHVLCVVQPKRFTEIVQQNDISSIMDDSAVFSTAQQQTFVNSIAAS